MPSVADLLSLEYSNKRREAMRKGLEFTLTKEEFVEIVLSPCTYCGSAPTTNRSFWNRRVSIPPVGLPYVRVNGIDRAKSSRGYTKKNSLPCCWDCNRAKGSMPIAKFDEWIGQVYEHRSSWSYLNELHRPSLTDIVPRMERKKRKEALRLQAEIFKP